MTIFSNTGARNGAPLIDTVTIFLGGPDTAWAWRSTSVPRSQGLAWYPDRQRMRQHRLSRSLRSLI